MNSNLSSGASKEYKAKFRDFQAPYVADKYSNDKSDFSANTNKEILKRITQKYNAHGSYKNGFAKRVRIFDDDGETPLKNSYTYYNNTLYETDENGDIFVVDETIAKDLLDNYNKEEKRVDDMMEYAIASDALLSIVIGPQNMDLCDPKTNRINLVKELCGNNEKIYNIDCLPSTLAIYDERDKCYTAGLKKLRAIVRRFGRQMKSNNVSKETEETAYDFDITKFNTKPGADVLINDAVKK